MFECYHYLKNKLENSLISSLKDPDIFFSIFGDDVNFIQTKSL